MTNEKYHNINLLKQTFARALYDNKAEMPRELSFKKGDILTVLQENYENYSDWWVCSLKNKVGLAPANRLEAMTVFVDNNSRQSISCKSPTSPIYNTLMSQSLYDELPDRSPQYFNYSQLPNTSQSNNAISASAFSLDNSTNYFNIQSDPNNDNSNDTYSTYQMPLDTPTTPINTIYQTPVDKTDKSFNQQPSSYFSLKESDYSTPQQFNQSITNQKINPQLNQNDYVDNFVNMTIHSIPKSNSASSTSLAATTSNNSASSSESSELRGLPPPPTNNFLMNMTLDQSLERFQCVYDQSNNSVDKTIEFLYPKWQTLESLRTNINKMKVAFKELLADLVSLIDFINCALQNANISGDKELTRRISKHLNQLHEYRDNIIDYLEQIELKTSWLPEKLTEHIRLSPCEGRDYLSRIISCARNIKIHSRSLSVVIRGNATVLFKHSVELYRADTLTKTAPVQASIEATPNTSTSADNRTSKEIKDILNLYLFQLKSQNQLTKKTIDDFLELFANKSQLTVDSIMSNTRFVLRTGTQLVCIAKNLTDANISYLPNNEIEKAGNLLCDSLKTVFSAVKTPDQDFSNNYSSIVNCLNQVKLHCDVLESIVTDSMKRLS